MKNIIPFFAFLLFTFEFVNAQAPQATSYQAVIRNSSGNALSNQLVKVRFSIHDSAANGTVVYQETQTPTTNAQGLINLFAGQGTAVTGTFAGINWGSKSKFLQTEIDITGGNNYTDMGTMQLMSVPYALYSNVANTANNGLPTGTSNGDILYWNGASWQKLTAGTYGQSLTICDGVPTWGGCTPKLTTNAAPAVSYTTATSGGNVTTEGGVSVTARGVCWSTSLNPTIALTTKTVNGTGAGSFTSSITGLSPNTLYHVRAYATNSVGTSYGADLTFTTLATTIPTVTTTAISSILNTTATSGGNVSSDGGASVNFRGVCWSTTTNPTISLTTKTVDGTGTGAFTSSITSLSSNTTYYVRAYATNNVGTAYGAQQTFTTASAVANLPSVTIGTQVWTNQNLSVASYRNGDIIPQVTDATQWGALTTGAWCWYNNDSATYAATYGRLYNWYAVNDARGLAPQGWHVPSNAEWDILVKFLDASADTNCVNCYQSYIAGGTMKSTVGWNAPNAGASNSSGFTALPGGYRNVAAVFDGGGGRLGYWWSASQSSTIEAWFRGLYYNENIVYRGIAADKRIGWSVRCVKD